jgi:chromosome segregation ATPase
MEEDARRVGTELAEVKGEKEALQQQMMELMN